MPFGQINVGFFLQKIKLRKIESVARLDFDWIGQVVDTELLIFYLPPFCIENYKSLTYIPTTSFLIKTLNCENEKSAGYVIHFPKKPQVPLVNMLRIKLGS